MGRKGGTSPVPWLNSAVSWPVFSPSNTIKGTMGGRAGGSEIGTEPRSWRGPWRPHTPRWCLAERCPGAHLLLFKHWKTMNRTWICHIYNLPFWGLLHCSLGLKVTPKQVSAGLQIIIGINQFKLLGWPSTVLARGDNVHFSLSEIETQVSKLWWHTWGWPSDLSD